MGDTGVGKTTLLRKNDGKSVYDFKIYQDCPRCYKTFSANIYSTKVEIGETSINLEIWDTSECDETKNCETLDSKSYPYSVNISIILTYHIHDSSLNVLAVCM